jgi:hypothetical protein
VDSRQIRKRIVALLHIFGPLWQAVDQRTAADAADLPSQ